MDPTTAVAVGKAALDISQRIPNTFWGKLFSCLNPWNTYRRWKRKLPKGYKVPLESICRISNNKTLIEGEIFLYSPTKNDFNYFVECITPGLRLKNAILARLDDLDFSSVHKLSSRISELLGCKTPTIDSYRTSATSEDKDYSLEKIKDQSPSPHVRFHTYESVEKHARIIAGEASRTVLIFHSYNNSRSETVALLRKIAKLLAETSEHRLKIIARGHNPETATIKLPEFETKGSAPFRVCKELGKNDEIVWNEAMFFGNKVIGVGDIAYFYRQSQEKSISPKEYAKIRADAHSKRIAAVLSASKQAKQFHEEFNKRLEEIKGKLNSPIDCGKEWRRLFLHARHMGAFDRCQYLIGLAKEWLEGVNDSGNLLRSYVSLHEGEILHEIARESQENLGRDIRELYRKALSGLAYRYPTDEAYVLNNLAICEKEFFEDRNAYDAYMKRAIEIVRNAKGSPNTFILIISNFYDEKPSSIPTKDFDRLGSSVTNDAWFNYARLAFRAMYYRVLHNSQALVTDVTSLIELVETNQWLAVRCGNFRSIVEYSGVSKKLVQKARSLIEAGMVCVEQFKNQAHVD